MRFQFRQSRPRHAIDQITNSARNCSNSLICVEIRPTTIYSEELAGSLTLPSS